MSQSDCLKNGCLYWEVLQSKTLVQFVTVTEYIARQKLAYGISGHDDTYHISELHHTYTTSLFYSYMDTQQTTPLYWREQDSYFMVTTLRNAKPAF